jgi:hypothetical protein
MTCIANQHQVFRFLFGESIAIFTLARLTGSEFQLRKTIDTTKWVGSVISFFGLLYRQRQSLILEH